MESAPIQSRVLKFGLFTADLESGELHKNGVRQKLAGQPFEVLRLLLEHSQQVVTREQFQEHIWAGDTFVDYDLALRKAITRIREVLGDSAESPRFIETIPRRGYRFIAPVSSDGHLGANAELPEVATGTSIRGFGNRIAYGIAAGLVLCLVAGGFLWRRSFKSATPQIRSIAVLPLQNLSGDPAQEYFSDGMTDALITDLAQIGSLKVISRTSSMRYKQTTKSLPQIARELNVDSIVEGTVQRSGDHVRITTQLIDGANDRHLWAQSYEGSLRDMLDLQSKVASAIAGEIKIQVTPQEKKRLASARPVDMEAQEAYLKGRYYLNQRTEEGFRRALEYFREATQRDPSYALGYSGLADSYVLLGEYSLLPANEAFTNARQATAKALELDDTLAEAHNTLAAVKVDYDWDWPGAEHEFRRAIELNPGYATAHQWYAELLCELGRHQEAMAEIKLAQQLDPFSLIINAVNGDVLRTAGLDDLSIAQLRRTLEINPDFAHAHFHLAMTYMRKQAFPEAIAEFQRAATLSPNVSDYQGGLGYAYGRAGKRAEARKVLDELRERSKRKYVPWFYVAAIYSGLGEKDQAFASLERAYERREQGLAVINRAPMFDPLRSDPRYQDLLRRMDLQP